MCVCVVWLCCVCGAGGVRCVCGVDGVHDGDAGGVCVWCLWVCVCVWSDIAQLLECQTCGRKVAGRFHAGSAVEFPSPVLR